MRLVVSISCVGTCSCVWNSKTGTVNIFMHKHHRFCAFYVKQYYFVSVTVIDTTDEKCYSGNKDKLIWYNRSCVGWYYQATHQWKAMLMLFLFFCINNIMLQHKVEKKNLRFYPKLRCMLDMHSVLTKLNVVKKVKLLLFKQWVSGCVDGALRRFLQLSSKT